MNQSVAKAIEILRAFTLERPELGIADLSRHLHYPPSVVSRLVTTLKKEGLLEQVLPNRKYRIAHGLFELGARYANRNRGYGFAAQALSRLVAQTGHTGYVGILVGTDVIVLARHEGVHRVRLIVNVGERFPAHATAIGKALLSRMTDAQIRALYEGRSLEPVTDRTITTLADLLANVRMARQRGYAAADQETFPGVRAVGAALHSAADGESFAVSLSYPNPSVSRFQEREMIRQLLTTVREVGHTLGDPWWMTLSASRA